MSNEELAQKLDENSKKIMENFNEIQNNATRIQQNSGALEILRDYKSDSKRWFTILIIVLFMWFLTIGYLVYILNDTGTIEETITQENESGYNNYIGNDGDIHNGETNDKN